MASPAAAPAAVAVSLNGSRDAGDGPAVPMSPGALAESALAAVAAGAGEVLVHPRTPCGRESLSPRVVGPVLEVLRRTGVGVALSVSVLLYGRDAAAWPLLRLAARCGTGVRTGVGDVTQLPGGRPARSNAELVAAARDMVAEAAATAASR
ncbi:3-keto-5-aminohexanoate cleavage protein [Streptomyces sp. NPDC090036]|uniref:3-keto-5-aminohexanoate cleavage protein n=1 Tax=Streptomyces sp. NPDC090036 TaxID=3365926 RepID=UPI003817B768